MIKSFQVIYTENEFFFFLNQFHSILFLLQIWITVLLSFSFYSFNSFLNGAQSCLLQHLWSKPEQQHFVTKTFLAHIIHSDLILNHKVWSVLSICVIYIAMYESMSWSMKKLGVHKHQFAVPDNDCSSRSVMWPGLQSLWDSAEMCCE